MRLGVGMITYTHGSHFLTVPKLSYPQTELLFRGACRAMIC